MPSSCVYTNAFSAVQAPHTPMWLPAMNPSQNSFLPLNLPSPANVGVGQPPIVFNIPAHQSVIADSSNCFVAPYGLPPNNAASFVPSQKPLYTEEHEPLKPEQVLKIFKDPATPYNSLEDFAFAEGKCSY